MQPYDELDLSILGILEEDGRIPVSKLAKRLGRSVSTIRDRIQKLEEGKAILGYTALIDPAKLGFGIKVVVQVIRDQSIPIETIFSALDSMPEIVNVQLLTGDIDELVTIYVRSVDHLRDFLYDSIMQLPGVSRTNSAIILSERKKSFTCHMASRASF